jgi:uncharacterized membrane protein
MKKYLCILTMAGALTLGSVNTASAQEVKETVKTKKGWSKKAKYSVIGAAAGAGTGVLVGKNDSKSAIIGGAIGAGTGYLYGRHKDKKSPARSSKYVYKRKVDY